MNTASIVLCQELYTLTKWEDYSLPHYAESCHTAESYEYIMSNDFGDAFPAYTLDYLMRKLPEDAMIGVGDGTYWASYRDPETKHLFDVSQDTPENVACLLAIRLYKQGLIS